MIQDNAWGLGVIPEESSKDGPSSRQSSDSSSSSSQSSGDSKVHVTAMDETNVNLMNPGDDLDKE